MSIAHEFKRALEVSMTELAANEWSVSEEQKKLHAAP
jgi:hypothetical protein